MVPEFEDVGRHEGRVSGERPFRVLLDVPRDSFRQTRKAHGIEPQTAQIDTMAAEFPAQTNYLYGTYHAEATDVEPSWRKKVILCSERFWW